MGEVGGERGEEIFCVEGLLRSRGGGQEGGDGGGEAEFEACALDRGGFQGVECAEHLVLGWHHGFEALLACDGVDAIVPRFPAGDEEGADAGVDVLDDVRLAAGRLAEVAHPAEAISSCGAMQRSTCEVRTECRCEGCGSAPIDALGDFGGRKGGAVRGGLRFAGGAEVAEAGMEPTLGAGLTDAGERM